MCKAKMYLEEMKEVSSKIAKDFREMSEALSNYDKAINKHYHVMETVDFNARDGFKAYKYHQKLLRGRRAVKYEMDQLKAMQQALGIEGFHRNLGKATTVIRRSEESNTTYTQGKWGNDVEKVIEDSRMVVH